MDLNSKIEFLLNGLSINSLAKEREKLTQAYRNRDGHRELKSLITDQQRLAYLSTRLPATYAVVHKVLKEALSHIEKETVTSLMDVGAGPGTAFLAAETLFPALNEATMIERDPGFITLGKFLAEEINHIKQTWICQDATKEFPMDVHDVVIASYSLNELHENRRCELIEKLWKCTGQILILIEPGSKSAFEFLKKIRQSLLLKGAHLIAPCPHSLACPLAEKDWCHFSARVQRTSLHRKMKDATLNYEDEKFSYLIFSKNSFAPCQARILRRPFKGEGFVKLQICSRHGLDLKTVTKKNKTHYSYAKKLECGDHYNDVQL